MKDIRCFVVDDEKDARERMVILLGQMEAVKITGFEGDPAAAVSLIAEKLPDLVFVDIEMPGMSGFELIRAVRERSLAPGFIFVTGHDQYAIRAIRNEAFDFLLKPVDIDELSEAIARFRRTSRDRTRPAAARITLPGFSDRELEVIRLIAACKTAKQIAEELNISKLTVDTHRKKILEKTGLHKISELIVFANDNGLV